MRLSLVIALLGLVGCHAFGARNTPIHYDIGVVERKVTTSSPEAQLWFDRGLALTYGFNHEEAIRCFERAAEADPRCAMAYWGKAYALGPNYNNVAMTEESSRSAYEALQRALAEIEHTTPVEQDLIRALRARYPGPELVERPPVEAAYAEAMRRVYARHPDDSDVAALTGEALMMLRPWKLFSADGQMAPETPEILRVLESALDRWPRHPALCHLYIHAMEASPEVRKAIPAAERLETLTPGLGHLVHMPSHIYTWTGRYDDVVRTNQEAVRLDEAYVRYAGRNNFYTLYRIHNYHFVAYGAMFDGRRKVALAAARKLVREIPPEFYSNPLLDFADIFSATPYHVMVRFGLWHDVLAEPEPEPPLFAAKAVHHYARGVALAALGRVQEALREQELFLEAKRNVPPTRQLFNNHVSQILPVGEAVLAGEIEYRRGNMDQAFEHLRRAVELDDALNYEEPWGWMEPARHALGALLTEQGRYEEAVEVYRADLARFPENGWALHGLAECLSKLGQSEQAERVRTRFDRAWARADIEIPGSCFCRMKQLETASR